MKAAVAPPRVRSNMLASQAFEQGGEAQQQGEASKTEGKQDQVGHRDGSSGSVSERMAVPAVKMLFGIGSDGVKAA